ncbi:MAG: hypothetical protein ACYTGX_13295 [Planctomycetota bacterium]|jgi:hypothetical protein
MAGAAESGSGTPGAPVRCRYTGGEALGSGTAELAGGGLRLRGRIENDNAGCGTAVLFALLGLVFGGKFVFDDLGVDLSGRRPGATAVVILVAIVLLPAWLGYALMHRLRATKVDEFFPLERLHRSPTKAEGRIVVVATGPEAGSGRIIALHPTEPAAQAAAQALWDAAPPPPDAQPPGTCELDDQRVRRWLEDGQCESVHFAALAHVAILTTADGPFGPDLFWVLVDLAGNGCVIPGQADIAEALLERVQKLPGFDNATLIKAMSSTEEAKFPLWTKS